MADHSIDVTFDYNNGTPKWTFAPPSVRIPNKEHAKLFWTLTNESTKDAVFSPSGGIAFKPSAPGYPGSEPALQNPKKYESSEFNDNPGPNKQVFAYVARVTYNGTEYQSPDPDVTNDPPGHVDHPGHDDHDHHHEHHRR
jgi:hypothetical protein